MNRIKKTLLAVVALVCTPMMLEALESKDRVLNGIVSNHTRTFAVNDLFKNRIDFNNWNSAINGVRSYIYENAQGDRALINNLNAILRQNDELINTIKITYNTLFASEGCINQPQVIANSFAKFKNIDSISRQIESNLRGTFFFYQKKKDAREILVALAGYIGATAQAAANNLRRRTGS